MERKDKGVTDTMVTLEHEYSSLFIKHKRKAKAIREKLKKAQKELTEKEFQITNTFEKMIGRRNGRRK